MYIYDLILIIFSLIALFVVIAKDKLSRKYIIIMMIFNLAILLMHTLISPIKWQVIPMYALSILLILFMDIRFPKRWIGILLSALYVLTVVFSTALLYVFPLSEIPDPSGSLLVGTKDFIIDDVDRLEYYTEDPSDTRSFVFRMWYPTDTTDQKELSLWIGNLALSRGLASGIGLPQFVLDQTSYITSNSYIDAPISQQESTYPVIIISHGWGGFMSLHSDLAEELASRGYVVVSIDHTYGSVATKLNDRTVMQNMDALPDRSESGFLEAANQLVYTYAGDVSKTLDYLEAENEITSDAFFKGRLDLEHIGLLGHSTGGGADVAVALNDPRIDALIGLDAWVEPIQTSELDKGLTIPAIFLRSEAWEVGYNNEYLYPLIQNSSQAKLYQIDGTTHSDFSMAYMFSPLTGMIGYTGSLDKGYLLQMQKDIMNLFFDEHLKGNVNQSIDLSQYLELKEIILS